MAAELLKLIDELIAEHKDVKEQTHLMENVSSDIVLLSELKKAGQTHISDKIDETKNLEKLEEMLVAIDIWVKRHFSREEYILTMKIKDRVNGKIIESLNSLMFEHSDLRSRLEHSKIRVNELISGYLEPNVWEATAKDITAYLNHTCKLLETHAEMENKLFLQIRKTLKNKSKL